MQGWECGSQLGLRAKSCDEETPSMELGLPRDGDWRRKGRPTKSQVQALSKHMCLDLSVSRDLKKKNHGPS